MSGPARTPESKHRQIVGSRKGEVTRRQQDIQRIARFLSNTNEQESPKRFKSLMTQLAKAREDVRHAQEKLTLSESEEADFEKTQNEEKQELLLSRLESPVATEGHPEC